MSTTTHHADLTEAELHVGGYIGESTPSDTTEGKFWLKASTETLSIYVTGTGWVNVRDALKVNGSTITITTATEGQILRFNSGGVLVNITPTTVPATVTTPGDTPHTITLTAPQVGEVIAIGANDTLVNQAAVSGDLPIGTIVAYGGATAPAGWFLCDGSEKSNTTYAALLAIIGTAYGSGSGTFKVPDIQDRFPLGKGTSYPTLNDPGGATTVTLSASQIPAHAHKGPLATQQYFAAPGSQSTQMGAVIYGAGGTSTTNNATANSTGGGSSHNNMPPYVVVNYIIKY